MCFGVRLRQARLNRCLTQKQLADAAGISLRSIIYYECQGRHPRRTVVYYRLAYALGIAPAELISGRQFISTVQSCPSPRPAQTPDHQDLYYIISTFFNGLSSMDLSDDELNDLICFLLDEAHILPADPKLRRLFSILTKAR